MKRREVVVFSFHGPSRPSFQAPAYSAVDHVKEKESAYAAASHYVDTTTQRQRRKKEVIGRVHRLALHALSPLWTTRSVQSRTQTYKIARLCVHKGKNGAAAERVSLRDRQLAAILLFSLYFLSPGRTDTKINDRPGQENNKEKRTGHWHAASVTWWPPRPECPDTFLLILCHCGHFIQIP